MIRWRSLLPRLAVLSLLGISGYLLATPISRVLFLHTAQQLSGAQVEVGDFDISFDTGQVRLTNWQIADSRQPSRNLFQAKQATLQIEMAELWQRRWVIKEAFFSGVQFGTPRTALGGFSDKAKSADLATTHYQRRRNPADPLSVDDWWTPTEINAAADPVAEMEMEKISQDLGRWWPAELAKLETYTAELQQQSQQIRTELTKLRQNPLRDRQRAELTERRAGELSKDVLAARESLKQLWQRWENDKQRLAQAGFGDLQINQRNLRIQSPGAVEIDSQRLSRLLLKVYAEEWTAATLDWLQCFQDALPAVETNPSKIRGRGFDVRFRENPPLVIEKTELEGEGNLNGRLFDFTGQINHLSTAPKWTAEPVTFTLQSKGENATRLSGIIDRRGSQSSDSLFIACPRLTTEPRVLGQTDSILVKWSAGILELHGEVRLQANQLRGFLHLQPTDLQLQVQQIAPLQNRLPGESLHLLPSINRALQDIHGFDLSIELFGSLQEPRFRLTSDLGAMISSIVTEALQEHQRMLSSEETAALKATQQQNLLGLENLVLARYSALKETLERDLLQVVELRTLAQQTSQNSGQIR